MEKHDEELRTPSEEIQEVRCYNFPINLKNIEHISARRTGDILAVFNTMKRCEELELTPDQRMMLSDIVDSVNEHSRAVSGYYLVRYGMLLEREKSMTGKECFPHSANDG